MAESKAQIASLDGMKKRERRKVLKRMTREVMRDKRYRSFGNYVLIGIVLRHYITSRFPVTYS